ncbi:hypothetical protein SLEP1_g10978 [Rubroshorea leprosula]|uniref:Retrotransposon Copia-like N-terminal domain-containing protein n=1 Tax=Rubroshorea leprosula TaxID=152421 RepID=A0AAV5IKM4_9ROSI|nr:hypothetical protein SLEP1_g10978 [Rubroshorea leprosula]
MAFDDSTPNPTRSSSNETIDLSSIDQYNNPFYLHPSDNLGNILVSILLIGDSYATWRCAVIITLTEKNKLGFVDGKLPRPASDSPNFQSWTGCNTIITSLVKRILFRLSTKLILLCYEKKGPINLEDDWSGEA